MTQQRKIFFDLERKDYVCATVCTSLEKRSTFRCGVITANAKLFPQRTIAEIASEVKLPCSRKTPRYAAIVFWTPAVVRSVLLLHSFICPCGGRRQYVGRYHASGYTWNTV